MAWWGWLYSILSGLGWGALIMYAIGRVLLWRDEQREQRAAVQAEQAAAEREASKNSDSLEAVRQAFKF